MPAAPSPRAARGQVAGAAGRRAAPPRQSAARPRAGGLKWLSDHGNPYVDSFYDAEGRLGIDFGVYGVPETFVIDRQGVVRYKHTGPMTPLVLQKEILPLLRRLEDA